MIVLRSSTTFTTRQRQLTKDRQHSKPLSFISFYDTPHSHLHSFYCYAFLNALYLICDSLHTNLPLARDIPSRHLITSLRNLLYQSLKKDLWNCTWKEYLGSKDNSITVSDLNIFNIILCMQNTLTVYEVSRKTRNGQHHVSVTNWLLSENLLEDDLVEDDSISVWG